MKTKDERTVGTVCFITGGLLGAAIALLFAPQSGKRTRRDIRRVGSTAKNKAEKIRLELGRAMDGWVDDFADQLQGGIAQGQDWVDQAIPGVLQALGSGKQYIKAEIDKFTKAGDSPASRTH
jgi:gas vesicle protein